MSSAFLEPPDSGDSRSAEAIGASSNAPATTTSSVRSRRRDMREAITVSPAEGVWDARREVMRLRRREVSKAAGILFMYRPAAAAGAAGRARADSVRRRTAGAWSHRGRSSPLKLRRALLQERGDALHE